MVTDEGEVAVLLAPGHLVDADIEQLIQAVGVELVAGDALDDPPNGAPVDPHQPADRALVGPRSQVGDEALEVPGEVRARTGERNALGAHPMNRAGQSPQLRTDLKPPDPEIQVAPDREHRPDVVAVRGAERALRAHQTPAAQRHLHDDPVGLEANPSDPDALQP